MSEGSPLSKLFVRYRRQLVHEVMRRRGGSRSDAEDAVQEAFLSIHKRGGLDGCTNLLRHAMVAIDRWEHTFPQQHSLSCAAAPVITEFGSERPRIVTFNLTGIHTIPVAVVHQLELIATRLRLSVRSTTQSRTRLA